jgi:hypothetical protein
MDVCKNELDAPLLVGMISNRGFTLPLMITIYHLAGIRFCLFVNISRCTLNDDVPLWLYTRGTDSGFETM